MLQQMMQLMSKLNTSMEKMAASLEEIRNTFPAQPECNPRGQNLGSTSGGQKHKQVKVATILWIGKTLALDFPPPKPLVLEDEEVENLEENDQPKRKGG